MKNSSNGCLVAVILVIILVGLLAAASLLFFFKARNVAMDERIPFPVVEITAPRVSHGVHFSGSDSEKGTLILQPDEMRRLPMPQAGEEITRERFAAFMVDEDATELAKEAFRKVANQASVSWLLRTENVAERDGALHGQFRLPWQVRNGNARTMSTINVQGVFTDESRPALLKLRRGDWVTVQGQLSLDRNSVVLKNARLAPKSPPAEAE